MAKASGNEAAVPIQKPALRMIDTAHQAGGNAETRIEKDAPVIGKAALPIDEVDSRREQDRRRPAIKLRQHRDKTLQFDGIDTLLGNEAIEHVAFVETLHNDEPIDGNAGAGDRESFAGIHQGRDVEINVRRERAIEAQFGPASGLPSRQTGKVEIRKADRFLELVDPVADQKDP